MDLGVRLRAAYRRSPRPPHPPRQHPRDERRELQAQPEPQASRPSRRVNRPTSPRLTPWAHRPHPRALPRQPVEARRVARGALPWTTGTSPQPPVVPLYTAAVVLFCSAIDRNPHAPSFGSERITSFFGHHGLGGLGNLPSRQHALVQKRPQTALRDIDAA